MVLILDGYSETGVHVRQSLMFDLFRAFDRIERSHKFGFFLYKYICPSGDSSIMTYYAQIQLSNTAFLLFYSVIFMYFTVLIFR